MNNKSLSRRLMTIKVLIYTLLTLCILPLSSLNIHAAYSIQNIKLSSNLSNVTIAQAFKHIEANSEFVFFYADNVKHALNQKTSVSSDSKSIEEVLETVLEASNLTYVITDKQISILLEEKAQQQVVNKKVTYTGVVTDISHDPLIGVAVMLKGTKVGSITDIDAKFSINAEEGDVLVLSYVGFKTKEVKLGAEQNLGMIMLDGDTKLLDEIVVVGYGTMEKRQVTSSISSVKGSDLAQGVGGASIATALKGKISGLSITGTSSPNSDNSIQLRGVASVYAGKGPLVVIDGIPGGDIRSLNQEDIESIDVLKDGSAGAIYGTRAAGGVILITTKKAQKGPVKVIYTGELSMETLRKRPETLSANEFLEHGLGGKNDVYNYGGDSDWYDMLMNKNPLSNRHVINVSGGSDVANIYTTFTMQDQKGIAIGDGRKDYSGRINANFKMYDGIVEIFTHAEYREAIRDKRRSNGMYNAAMKLNPTMSPYDADSPSGYNLKDFKGDDFNPLADVNLRTRGGTDKWLLADATLKVNLTKDLSVQATAGHDSRQYQGTEYVSANHRESDQGGFAGKGFHSFNKTANVSFETYANYSRVIQDHTMSVVGGYSFFEKNQEQFDMTNFDFPVERVGPWDMGSGNYLSDGKAKMTSSKSPRERLLAVFGRVNYSFKDKYLATASVRHEGSSKFSPSNRFGTFWAVSGGWRINDETFMKDVTFVNDLKLRLGYGVTGNNSFESYPGLTERVYGSNGMWLMNGQKWSSLYGSVRNVNTDLKWEEKKELNFGIDYSFLNNRIYGKFDLYNRKVDNLLFHQGVSQPPSVYPTTLQNIGTLENRGWELEIGGIPVQTKEFEYSTIIRMSQNTSKIKSMGTSSYVEVDDGNFPSPGNPGNPYRLTNNLELGQWYMKKHAGIDEQGRWLVYDKDDNIILAKNSNNDDKRYLGNAMPKLILSWDHTLTYKNWDMSVFLRSWIGFDVFNMADMYYGVPSKTNSVNYLKKAFSEERKNISEEKQLSDYWLEDGTFLKIDAVVVGYNLNLKKYNRFLEKARFYLNVRDLACFTNYSGLDPETDINGLMPGLDHISKDAVFPKTRRFTVGVQLTF